MSAAIFGNVSSIMLRLYRGAEEYHEQLSSIKEFIKFHYIPKQLGQRLIDSYQNTRSLNKGIDLNSVRQCFSNSGPRAKNGLAYSKLAWRFKNGPREVGG